MTSLNVVEGYGMMQGSLEHIRLRLRHQLDEDERQRLADHITFILDRSYDLWSIDHPTCQRPAGESGLSPAGHDLPACVINEVRS